MKKILLFTIILATIACALAITAGAEVTVYDDAPERITITVSESDVVVFDDGFSCPSAYIVKDGTFFGTGHVDFSYINEKTGKSYAFANIVEIDIPQGITSVVGYTFNSNTTIKRVSIPNTVDNIGACLFERCSSIEECTFEHGENDGLETITNWVFAYCTSLKALSLPDCVKYFTGNNQLGGCTSLTALYLPKNLISTEGGSNTNATFGGLTNAYFVNEPFTYDAIPAKPDVYYFPENYHTGYGEIFDSWKNINKVLVFRADNIIFENAWTFEAVADGEGGKPTIVFTGDVASINVGSWNVEKIYFANKNDIDVESAGVTGNKSFVFCNAEGNATHLKELTKGTEASCEMPKMVADYCFCGAIMGEPVTEGVALGHDYTGAVTYEFESFTTPAKKCTECVNGCGIAQTEEIGTAFKDKGYAVKIFGEYGITGGYEINQDILALYETLNQVDVDFGFGFNAAGSFTDGEVTIDSFAINVPIREEADKGGNLFDAYIFTIYFGEDDTHLNSALIVGAYVIEKGADGEKVTFINRGEGETNGFYSVTYNSIANK